MAFFWNLKLPASTGYMATFQGLAIPLAQKMPSTERRALFGCQRRCHKKLYLTSSHWTWRALGKQKKGKTVKAGTWLWSYLQMFFGNMVKSYLGDICLCTDYTAIRSFDYFVMIFGVPWVVPTAKVFFVVRTQKCKNQTWNMLNLCEEKSSRWLK